MALTTITGNMVSVNAIQGTLIADNAITAVHIATNAVSGTLIADNAVTAVHIAQNSITVTQLADDCVESDKIADGIITTNHLNKAMISSQTEVTAVAGDFVLLGDTSDSNNLKKTLVSSIAALSTVGTGDITTAKIAANAVDSTKIASNSILTRHIDDDQITGDQLADALTVVTSVTTPLVDAAIVDGENFKINGGQGSDGQVLTSTGSGVAWEAAVSSFAALSDTVVSTSAPATNTNPSSGVGTLWLDKSAGDLYVCTSATSNSNIWLNIGDGTGQVGGEPSGGTESTAGGYKYHAFTSSGTLTVPAAKTGVDVLIVAGGGGGGGRYNAGGGGAGGAASGRTRGVGRANNISGTSVTYAEGGYGQGTSNFINAGVSGTTNRGNGGNGANNGSNSGGGGGSGVIIIKYPDSYTISLTGIQGTTSNSGGYNITTLTSGTGSVSW